MDDLDGGLRDRLVAVGVELVTTEGMAALSLRKIARRAGVSHGAPRRYFPTHLELLSAIARQGFVAFDARAKETLSTVDPGDPRAGLAALSRLYVEFALANRGMFELMFRHDLLESNRLGLRDSSLPLFDAFAGLVARAGVRRPDAEPAPTVAAGALWANLHGIAQLWAWGSLPLAARIDAVGPLVDAALDAHLGRAA